MAKELNVGGTEKQKRSIYQSDVDVGDLARSRQSLRPRSSHFLSERANMASVKSEMLQFSSANSTSDPANRSVLIVGQLPNLTKVPYDIVKTKLQPRVTEEVIICLVN